MFIEKEILYYIQNPNKEINILKYVSSGLYKNNIEKVAEDMINDKYYIPNIGYTENLFDEKYNRSTLRLIHGFTILYPLIHAYNKTQDSKYLLKGLSMIEQWIEEFRYENSKKSMAFHDETTSLRLNNFIYFFDICKDKVEIKYIKKLYQEIKSTAYLLSQDYFYTKNTNHGMFQDISLVLYSKYFIKNKESDYYYELSKARLKSYFEYIYFESGVHKEHSPAYHFLVSYKILKLSQELFILDIEFKEYLYKLYLRTCDFSTYIIKPDGKLPNIGDTQPNIDVRQLYRNLYEDENYSNVIIENYDKVNLKTDYADLKSGYAVLRDKWGSDSVYVLFCASYNTSYHKHCDDLNFIIHYKGDIICEAGPFGYDYKDEKCIYGYSSFAHNTLIVNGESLPRIDKKYDSVKMIECELGEDKSIIKGINARYENVQHERTILFDKNNMMINIKDCIISKDINKYTLLFHLAPNLIPKQHGNEIEVYKDDKMICKIEFNSDKDICVNCSYGDSQEKIKGLNFPKMYETDYNYVIYVNIDNLKDINLNTYLKIY